jgi:hypothetical protein
MLNTSALRVDWGENRKEIEEAKQLYIQARKEGRLIVSVDDKTMPIEHFKPSLYGFVVKETELSETQFACQVIDETGDRRLIWDIRFPDQVKEAAKIFADYIAKGWRGYAVDTTGKQRRRIRQFNAETEEVLFEEISVTDIVATFAEKAKPVQPPTIQKTDKLKSFIKHFNKTILAPSTYPG